MLFCATPDRLQGWFSDALWRHYSYAPFNARVMENYFSLAFFTGYEAPWNITYLDPAALTFPLANIYFARTVYRMRVEA